SPVAHDGSIYCGSVDGSVYCLDHKTGRLRWRFHSDGPITGTPFISDNVIYIGSTDHKMYALMA
ncbi:MAG: PQQ-binding-like beta-propeller repeat protein, partial [Anaerolineales bacterium]